MIMQMIGIFPSGWSGSFDDLMSNFTSRSQNISKALRKLANIAWQTLLFVSESLGMDKKVTPDLRQKQ